MIAIDPLTRLPLTGREFSRFLPTTQGQTRDPSDDRRHVKATPEIATSTHDRDLADQTDSWLRRSSFSKKQVASITSQRCALDELCFGPARSPPHNDSSEALESIDVLA